MADLIVHTNLDQLFYTENIIYFLYETSCLNDEVNCTEPSYSVSIPCMDAMRSRFLAYRIFKMRNVIGEAVAATSTRIWGRIHNNSFSE